MPSKTVFVVDDSEIALEVASDALTSANFNVKTMANWTELDEHLQSVKPDLILMDVCMPDAYGDTALMFFRETRGMQDTPILLFSDLSEEELNERAKACEANGFISKSWGIDRMLEEVVECLSPA